MKYLSIIAALLIGGLAFYMAYQYYPQAPQEVAAPIIEKAEELPQTEEPEPIIEPVEEVALSGKQFTNYKNTLWNFSIDIPRETFANTKEGYVSVPVTTLDAENGVYIRPEYEVNYDGTKGEEATIETILAQDAPPIWYLQFEELASEEELLSYLKERYQPGCEILDQVVAGQPGVFNVTLKRTSPEVEEAEMCFINYITVIKYSPERNMVVTWDIGQDASFGNSDYSEIYDQIMADSFRFLQ